MRLPGNDSAPLNPPNPGVIKTLPSRETSVFEKTLPPLPIDIRTKNNSYLEIGTGLSENKWILIAGAIMLGPLPIGAPPFVLWLILFGQDDSVGIEIKLIGLVIALLMLATALPIYSIAFLSPEDEPIRFCRRDRKVYRYYTPRSNWLGMEMYHWKKPEIKVYEWSQCRAEVIRKIIGSTSSASYACFLEIAIVDPLTQSVTERFRVGDRDVHSDFSTRIFLWETIRRYMVDGADAVPATPFKTHRGNLLDCIEDFNPFSIPAKSAPGAQRFFGYILAAVWWVASIFGFLAAFSKWIGIKISRKINWGALDDSVFGLAPTDPALHRSLNPETAMPHQWQQEINRRKRMAWVWLVSLVIQWSGLWWFLIGPGRY